MLKVIDTLKLIRIFNCLLTMCGTGLGAYMIHRPMAASKVILAALAAFLVCAAGNAVNDLVDIEIDRVNRPSRALVRGALSPRLAFWLSVALNAAAVAVAMSAGVWVAVMVVSAILLLLAYNVYLKQIALVGNGVIGLLGAMTFMTGGFAVDAQSAFSLPGPLVPAVFAFLLHMVREILKDVHDIEGDRRGGIRTLPQIVGTSWSLLLALFLFLVLVALTWVPVMAGWFGPGYRTITGYVIDLPMTALLLLVVIRPRQKMLKIGSLGLKFCMVLGVVALLVA